MVSTYLVSIMSWTVVTVVRTAKTGKSSLGFQWGAQGTLSAPVFAGRELF